MIFLIIITINNNCRGLCKIIMIDGLPLIIIAVRKIYWSSWL